MFKKLELLAPAGSPEKMNYAFAYGADAVYIGIPDFSLRVRINKFDIGSVRLAIEKAHSLKKKVYVTVNIYAHNEHIKRLPEYLKKLAIWKPDALIISDPGILKLAKKYCSKIDIHLSTQANATNWQAVKFWQEQGAQRVILGREVTLEEIKEIHKRVPKMELEYFVHGAMCMSYSGRCMLSAWLTNRSANLGDCAQPCRWKYKAIEIEEEKRLGQRIPVEEDEHGTYIFNSKDLCLIEYLPELIEVGITSFKIEGRAKSVAYLATVIKAYREALDKGEKAKKSDLKKLKKIYLDNLMSRGYTTGFLFGKEKAEQETRFSHQEKDTGFVGEVLEYKKNGKKYQIVFKPHNALLNGSTIRILMAKGKDLGIKNLQLFNLKGEKIESAHGGNGDLAYFEYNEPILPKSILFKKD